MKSRLFLDRLHKEWPIKYNSALSVGCVNTGRYSNVLEPIILPFVVCKQEGGITGFFFFFYSWSWYVRPLINRKVLAVESLSA